jgi:ribosomal protein S8
VGHGFITTVLTLENPLNYLKNHRRIERIRRERDNQSEKHELRLTMYEREIGREKGRRIIKAVDEIRPIGVIKHETLDKMKMKYNNVGFTIVEPY